MGTVQYCMGAGDCHCNGTFIQGQRKAGPAYFYCRYILGGAYEYVCSVFTEIVFGKVFWDYSKIPFNLGGRINLLYCFSGGSQR